MLLETKRLLIREIWEEDIDELVAILGDSKVMKYSLKGPCSQEDAIKYLQRWMFQPYQECGFGLWTLISKETKKVIGFAGPTNQTIDDEECVEITYRIASNDWGKGYATEAVQLIRDYVFTQFQLDKVIAIIDPANSHSIHVAEKVGFKFSKMAYFHGFRVALYVLPRIQVVPYSET